jgi:hypothetical protein
MQPGYAAVSSLRRLRSARRSLGVIAPITPDVLQPDSASIAHAAHSATTGQDRQMLTAACLSCWLVENHRSGLAVVLHRAPSSSGGTGRVRRAFQFTAMAAG